MRKFLEKYKHLFIYMCLLVLIIILSLSQRATRKALEEQLAAKATAEEVAALVKAEMAKLQPAKTEQSSTLSPSGTCACNESAILEKVKELSPLKDWDKFAADLSAMDARLTSLESTSVQAASKTETPDSITPPTDFQACQEKLTALEKSLGEMEKKVKGIKSSGSSSGVSQKDFDALEKTVNSLKSSISKISGSSESDCVKATEFDAFKKKVTKAINDLSEED